MTGHSLGGALVGAVSTEVNVQGVGFSPPGLLFQKYQWDLDVSRLTKAFTVIQPTNDVVPQVDQQRGTHRMAPLQGECADLPPADAHCMCYGRTP